MDNLKTERVNLVLTPEEMERLQELADANTGKNMSMLLRELLNRAWERPKALGLHPPKAVALAG
jgi:predicted DNA-binding protein